jgi:hypothetical protein
VGRAVVGWTAVVEGGAVVGGVASVVGSSDVLVVEAERPEGWQPASSGNRIRTTAIHARLFDNTSPLFIVR